MNKTDRGIPGRRLLTLIYSVCILGIYLMIFVFSAEDAQQSSRVSIRVSHWIMQFFYQLRGSGNDVAAIGQAVEYAEGGIRKMAHFTEYLLLGFFSGNLAALWLEKYAFAAAVVALQLLLSGIADELHQWFVPGRYAAVTDVLIDFAGGLLGLTILFLYKMMKKSCFKRR